MPGLQIKVKRKATSLLLAIEPLPGSGSRPGLPDIRGHPADLIPGNGGIVWNNLPLATACWIVRRVEGTPPLSKLCRERYIAGMSDTLHIVGGGLAGSEAAWQAARRGIQVVLHEMRPKCGTFAHKTGKLAELVCSNSFRSDDDEHNAVGLLHWEMRQAGGIVIEAGDRHRLPAGGALAVDREAFADTVTSMLLSHSNVTLATEEIKDLPEHGHWIFATGPRLLQALLAKHCRQKAAKRA